MPTSRVPVRPVLLPLLALGLAIPAAALASPAEAAGSSGLVISEVYGGGGNTGATYTQDFVELANPTGSAITVDGTSLQYRSSGGSGAPSGLVALSGSVPAHGHYLVALAKGTGGSTALPTPDATGDVAMSATAGTVLLARGTSRIADLPTGSVARDDVIDLVGFGASNTYEKAPATGAGNTAAVSRDTAGTDTDDNSADLSATAPDPQSTGSGTTTPPPGAPTDLTIAQIQGTGAASPFAGRPVRTEGVVTASYPTGGFAGYYLQTPGTGGDLGSSHDASDAVFVYLGGSATASSYPSIGAHVQVTGTVSEFNGLTEISATSSTPLDTPAAAIEPVTGAYPSTDAGRETREGMLTAPGAFTVTDVYTLNNYAEIDLASGSTPLRQPTDVARPGTPEQQAVVADNAARAVTLDDGSSLNYLTTGKDTPLPWITKDRHVRVGAPARFTKPVILDYRNDTWKFQPTSQLTAANDAEVAPATFPDTRTDAPRAVGGDLKIASFNVLNYFTETGEKYVASGHSCSSYKDRTGTPVTVDDCGADGPRGAWGASDLSRQQAKIVSAINALDADVLSLEEIGNSAKFDGPEQRDDALSTLVDALNAAAGSDRWAFVPSPPVDQQPPLASQDVIRTAFIYQKAAVAPVGASHILLGSDAFSNARQPLGQVFVPAGGSSEQQFLAVVNHFKSKGSGSGDDADQGDGQGASNASRVRQAQALVGFVKELQASTGTQRVFLTGDFNAYTEEDPLQVLREAGFTDVGQRFVPDESTYVFGGLVGSLDHVLANDAALGTVQGAHVWNINSVESVAYEYSRHNYNATDFYSADPYRSSDHDPLLVGFSVPSSRTPSEVSAKVAEQEVNRRGRTTVRGTVTSDGHTVRSGTVTISQGDTELARVVLGNGNFRVRVFVTGTGKLPLQVAYSGTDTVAPSSTTVVANKPR
ncbi:hypothetical protein GCM10011519_00820 [Marmoricola endophyticus]|uniref:LTD domain-containing protein n=1 Tax=Marmoricola endophyticus TaxID=2040280 RepID=A0A917B8D2_9ACTN|nr:ExeM/NucH family extracellular endonuclease [Marmoricola endophyticus]GGF31270.1 hypothetical protein GCM10011519_00820 [Marmoricola endophyticus]